VLFDPWDKGQELDRLEESDSEVGSETTDSDLDAVLDLYSRSERDLDSPHFKGDVLDRLYEALEIGEEPEILCGVSSGWLGGSALMVHSGNLTVVDRKRQHDVTVPIGEVECEAIGEVQGRLAGCRLRFDDGANAKLKGYIAPVPEFLRIVDATGSDRAGFEERRLALPNSWAPDPGSLPVAVHGSAAVYRDRLIDSQGQHFPFNSSVQVSVDSAGGIAAVRGRNLGNKAMGTVAFGLLGALTVGNAKTEQIDSRTLHLWVEGETWVTSIEIDPDRSEAGRVFGSRIKSAASSFVSETQGGRPQHSPIENETQPGSGAGLVDELARLADLNERGLLSEQEFAQAKSKLLGS